MQTNDVITDDPSGRVSRRHFLRSAGALGALAGFQALLPSWARSSGSSLPAEWPVYPRALEPTVRVGNRVE